MKIATFTTVLLASSIASAAFAGPTGRVIAVNPVYSSVVRYDRQAVQETLCEDVSQGRRSDGLVERGANGVFGSPQGLIGTAAGVAIGSQIGGGSGTTWAMIVGGLLGNSAGNTVARNNERYVRVCRDVVVWRDIPQVEQEFQYYNVTIDIQGRPFTVKRYTEPMIGEDIPINLDVK